MPRRLALLLAALAAPPAAASDAVRGAETTFTSPNGVVERCVRIAPMPGADYSKGDLKDEEAYCAIDLYAADVAVCPKTWSTSPGMIVYDVSEGPYAGDRAASSDAPAERARPRRTSPRTISRSSSRR
jgi:hypothetical protein